MKGFEILLLCEESRVDFIVPTLKMEKTKA